MTRIIDVDALNEHKFQSPQVRVVGGRRNGKIKDLIISAYQKGWNDCIDAIIDNAPTVFDENAYSQGYKQGTCDSKNDRSTGKWIDIDSSVNKARCSKCKNIMLTEPFGKTDYCPNCGAKMVKGGRQ